MTLELSTLEDLPHIVQAMLPVLRNAEVVAFHGEMGAGKTTLIKAICHQLGVQDSVVSPTFSLVNEYRSDGGYPIFHFDFYRINTIKEAYDLGYEEYFFSGNLCLVEWPEKITDLLPDTTLHVYIDVTANGARKIHF